MTRAPHRNRARWVLAGFTVRPAVPGDASAIASLADDITALSGVPGFEPLHHHGDVERLLQTGSDLLVATVDEELCGMVRRYTEEGITWFDLLGADEPGAGRALVRAVEMHAQDNGIRLVRCTAPGERLPQYFAWLGYFPIAQSTFDGGPATVMERRLPLLTVRDQRREDAAFISSRTGRDSYAFEMGHRPGWFIAADGDRPVGLTWVSDAGGGVADITPPILDDPYRHRGLERWMLERAAYHASHAGYHTAQVALDEWLTPLERDLEDNEWRRDGDALVRRLAPPADDVDW